MRIALAALLWRQGQEAAAESEWEFACTNIAGAQAGACPPTPTQRPPPTVVVSPPPPPHTHTVGCTKYQDPEWLAVVRRWPPSMIAHLEDFLKLRSSKVGQEATARAAAARRQGAVPPPSGAGFLE